MGLTAYILESLQMDRFHPHPTTEVPTYQARWFDSHVIPDILYLVVRSCSVNTQESGLVPYPVA